MKRLYLIITILFILLPFSYCKKFILVGPPSTAIVGATAFNNDASATAAVLAIYSRIMEDPNSFCDGELSLSALCALSADELDDYGTEPGKQQIYTNSLAVTNAITYTKWSELYKYIYTCNAIIGGITRSSLLTSQVRQHLLGEARFIRAFCFFYLTNLFGDVPLILSTDYQQNMLAAQATRRQVYQQITEDLLAAKNNLSEQYLDAADASTAERVRPNRYAAQALLARVYLYLGDWQHAAAEADTVIGQTSQYSLLNDLNSVFLKNSAEAIWQLQPVVGGYNTYDGNNFILNTAPSPSSPVNNAAIRSVLYNAFEMNDQRKQAWLGSVTGNAQTFYYPFKYKQPYSGSGAVTEYEMVLRLAEQYLIRAEAKAELNDIAGAKSDLNIIRNRAGLPITAASSVPDLLTAILHERQVELFTEWGHRWLDLKRTERADSTLGAVKGIHWAAADTLYPIPKGEIQNDPRLRQNPGY